MDGLALGTHLFLVVADLDLGVVLEGAAGLHHELVDAPVLEVLLQHQGAPAHRQVEHVRPVDVCEEEGQLKSEICTWFQMAWI